MQMESSEEMSHIILKGKTILERDVKETQSLKTRMYYKKMRRRPEWLKQNEIGED